MTEKYTKKYHYPMGRVKRVEINSLGETTAAYVLKGSTKEVVYRHASSLIILLKNEDLETVTKDTTNGTHISDNQEPEKRDMRREVPKRKAAVKCRKKISSAFTDEV